MSIEFQKADIPRAERRVLKNQQWPSENNSSLAFWKTCPQHFCFPDMQRVVGLVRNLGAVAIGAGVVSEFCMYDVDAGNRVVIFDSIQGVLPGVYGEGTHLKLPWQVSIFIK